MNKVEPLSEFQEADAPPSLLRAGMRLHRCELFNWGTFHGRVWGLEAWNFSREIYIRCLDDGREGLKHKPRCDYLKFLDLERWSALAANCDLYCCPHRSVDD